MTAAPTHAGASPAASSVSGNFTQNAGKLEIELGGTTAGVQFDTVAVGGTATLGGTLEAKLIPGFTPTYGQKFQFLTATTVQGAFSGFVLPNLDGGQLWSLQNTGQSVALIVGLPGDYNGNGAVDAADYTVWRNTKGLTVLQGTGADGNRDSGNHRSRFRHLARQFRCPDRYWQRQRGRNGFRRAGAGRRTSTANRPAPGGRRASPWASSPVAAPSAVTPCRPPEARPQTGN